MDETTEHVAIRDSTIRLGQLLQLAGWADSGAEAKAMVATGDVSVNGVTETRRGAQLADGDVVGVQGRILRIASLSSS